MSESARLRTIAIGFGRPTTIKRLSPVLVLSFFGVVASWLYWDTRLVASSLLPKISGAPLSPYFDYEPVTVHTPSKHPNVTVSICLVVRNETIYMDEWVDFHISLGFGPIYIYDNADTKDLELEAWFERRRDINHLIHITHMPEAPVHGKALARCLQRDGPDATFAALIDVDEFVVLKRHRNVADFMVEHCDSDCGQLSLNWQTMGTSRETAYRPVPVTRRNVHVHTYKPLERIVKAIVRPGYAADYIDWSHTIMLKRGRWVDTDGTAIPRLYSTTRGHVPYEHRGPTDVAALYHYRFKSEEEFYAKSCVRGDAILERGVTPKCDHMSRPQNYPRVGGEMDDLAWRQLKLRVPKYAIFDEAILDPRNTSLR
ncbi:hypothetical protein ACHAXR_005281 [Thalassiosira sp. AJA248-18]